MTQGHPGIFIFALGEMWRLSLFVLDSLSLPLRPWPVTCLSSPSCPLPPTEAMTCGGWDLRHQVQIPAHLSAPLTISLFICKVGVIPGPAWKGDGRRDCHLRHLTRHSQPPGLERHPQAHHLPAHHAVLQSQHGAGREPPRPPRLPQCLAARGVLLGSRVRLRESRSLSHVRWS